MNFTLLPNPILIDSAEAVGDLLSKLEPHPAVAIDTETTGLDKEKDVPLLLSLSEGVGRYVVPEHLIRALKGWLEGTDKLLVFHNANYDTAILRNVGIDLLKNRKPRRADTVVMHHLTDENSPHDLKHLGRHVLGFEMRSYTETFGKGKKAVGILEAPADVAIQYASLDAYVTILLFERLKDALREIPGRGGTLLDYYFATEMPFTDTLYRMERRGMQIDAEYLGGLLPRISKEMEEIAAAFNELIGRPINLNSVPQLRTLFYDELQFPEFGRTKGGKSGETKPSVDEGTIKRWEKESRTELPGLLLRYRSLAKIRSTYVEGILSRLDQKFRVHTNFTQGVVVTGRLSSKEPNCHNIVRPDEDAFKIRQAFVGRDGTVLGVFDYEQLEMRLAAGLAEDPAMLEAIRSGKDLHAYSVSLMYKEPYEEVLAAKKAAEPTERQLRLITLRNKAKTAGFEVLYGGGAMRLTQLIEGISLAEAKDIIGRLFAAYPRLKEKVLETHEEVHEKGYMTTYTGRRRRLPWIHSSNPEEVAKAEREAFNVLCQGGAADVVRDAMLAIDHDPVLDGLDLVLQVHDELIFEVPTGWEEVAKTEIKRRMEDIPYTGIPLKTSAGFARSWLEAKG